MSKNVNTVDGIYKKLNLLNNGKGARLIRDQLKVANIELQPLPMIKGIDPKVSRFLNQLMTLIALIGGAYYLLSSGMIKDSYKEATRTQFFSVHVLKLMKHVITACKWIAEMQPNLYGTILGSISTLAGNRVIKLLTEPGRVFKFNKSNLAAISKGAAQGAVFNYMEVNRSSSLLNASEKAINDVMKKLSQNPELAHNLWSIANVTSGRRISKQFDDIAQIILIQGMTCILTLGVTTGMSAVEVSRHFYKVYKR